MITRRIFNEAIALVKEHFEVEDNQSDIPLAPKVLIQRLLGKMGTIILLTDRIDEEALSQCHELEIISNVAVGYNIMKRCLNSRGSGTL